MLKTHYLGRKHNRRVDHIVWTLVIDVMPNYDFHHRRQIAGLDGPDLEGACRQKILAGTGNMSLDSIQHIGGTKFSVASETHPGLQYAIDLTQSTCDCADFPRIRFCKHIAAINVHFPHLCLKESSPPEIPECVRTPDRPQPDPRSDEESVDILLRDINALSQQLTTVCDRSTPDLQALKSIKFSLKAAIALTHTACTLPEKDVFHPNRKTWAETAKWMGIRKAPKRKHSPTRENTSVERIGAVKGKHLRKNIDPYA